MVAAEAGLVVDAVVGGELVDEVHRLSAGGALGGRSLEGGRHCRLPSGSATAQHTLLPTAIALNSEAGRSRAACCWWLGYMGGAQQPGGRCGWVVGGWLAGCSSQVLY